MSFTAGWSTIAHLSVENGGWKGASKLGEEVKWDVVGGFVLSMGKVVLDGRWKNRFEKDVAKVKTGG